MDKFVKRELDFHFSRTNCARYLYILTAHVLWPGGVWDETEEKRSEAAKEKTRAEVLYVAGFFFLKKNKQTNNKTKQAHTTYSAGIHQL